MKSDEFLKEVLSSDICPLNFEIMYQEFREFQSAAYNTLIEFHRVCEKNKISYQLAFGSLLGVIRDGGQIPWDYDIDVFVSYQDKQLLIDALKRDLDDKYYFFCPEVDASCRHVIMRLTPKQYRTEALHVDVFYYVETSEHEEERRKHIDDMKRISNQRFYKLVKPHEESTGNMIKFLKLSLKKLSVLFKTVDDITKEYSSICERYSELNSLLCISADSFADWYVFPTGLLKETKLISVNGIEFRVPVEYEKMLNILYKDYNFYPSLETRIKEVVYNYSRLKYFENI